MSNGLKRPKTKLIHKKKRSPAKKRNFFIRLCFFLFHAISSTCLFFMQLIGSLFKKKSRGVAVFFTTLVCSLLIYFGILKTNLYTEKLLPTAIHIEINNPQVDSLISSDVVNALNHSVKARENRTQFLARVNNILASYDQIDEYWIRLGFDRILQISATLQVPLLILESKDGDKYVVSSNFKIISKNPNSFEFPGLFVLSAPDVKVSWKSKSLQKNGRFRTTYNGKLYTSNKESVNLPWLVNETRIIYSTFQECGFHYFVKNVAWNSRSGFQLNITSTPESQLIPSNNKISILLGKENFVPKIKKLSSIFRDLEKNNLHPNEIDLDYTDKASFKVSSTTTPTTMTKIL